MKTLNNRQKVKDQKIKIMKEADTQTTKDTLSSGNNEKNDYKNYNRGSNYYQQPSHRRWDRGFGYYRQPSHQKWSRKPSYYQQSPYTKRICEICEGNHNMWECDTYIHGKQMRDILYSLDRCDACLNKKQHHLNKCYNINRGERPNCFYCNKTDHESITCDGSKHPGSWIINERWRKKSDFERLPRFRCGMGLEIESRICSETAIENRSKGEFSISGIIVMDMQGIEKNVQS